MNIFNGLSALSGINLNRCGKWGRGEENKKFFLLFLFIFRDSGVNHVIVGLTTKINRQMHEKGNTGAPFDSLIVFLCAAYNNSVHHAHHLYHFTVYAIE